MNHNYVWLTPDYESSANQKPTSGIGFSDLKILDFFHLKKLGSSNNARIPFPVPANAKPAHLEKKINCI